MNSSLSTKANPWLFGKPVPRDSVKEVLKRCNEVDLWLFNEALPQYAAVYPSTPQYSLGEELWTVEARAIRSRNWPRT